MRFAFAPVLTLLAMAMAVGAQAQSVSDNLPGVAATVPSSALAVPATSVPSAASAAPAPLVDMTTVADVAVDVTADNAAHARDQALMQAEHNAYAQLCARVGAPENAAKLSDDAVAALVRSFDVQSEKVSAVRYIGVFTIRFKPAAIQKKLGKYMTEMAAAPGEEDPAKAAMADNAAHMALAVPTPSLAAFAQVKKRLAVISGVVRVDTLDLGRGLSHVDVLYTGSADDLQTALAAHGFEVQTGATGEATVFDRGTPQ